MICKTETFMHYGLFVCRSLFEFSSWIALLSQLCTQADFMVESGVHTVLMCKTKANGIGIDAQSEAFMDAISNPKALNAMLLRLNLAGVKASESCTFFGLASESFCVWLDIECWSNRSAR